MKTLENAPAYAERSNAIKILRTLAKSDTSERIEDGKPVVISAFVSRKMTRIDQLAMSAAGLIVIIEGRKELIDGANHRIYKAGEAFCLPANAHVDVVNTPDPGTGFYRALFIRFTRDLIIKAARHWPHLVGRQATNTLIVDADLCSAIVHTAQALSRQDPASGQLIEHRILEILLILAEQGVLPLVPKYMDGSVAEAVRLLVRHRLHFPWTAANVAAELETSEATLRRRLRSENQTFRGLLLEEKMKAAHIFLADRDADVAEAMAATGYCSRSHFTRNFQERFGASPSSVRKTNANRK